MSKVYIGVGHGAGEPGAAANGLVEADINLVTALACETELRTHGVITKISRTSREDGKIKINDKVKEADAFNPDFVVEIHYNAGGGLGSEVYYSKVGGKGKTLAQNILDSLVANGQKSRGIKTKLGKDGKDYFGMIRQTKAPAVLVEGGFLDSSDHKNFDTTEEQKALGVAIARGIIKTLELAGNPNVAIKPSVKIPKTIRKGSKGSEVRKLQTLLNASGYTTKISIDGDFGPKTYNAVIEYQRAKKIGIDGIVGPETWGKLLS